jgi:N-acyl-D-amino-acid deacylase
LHLITLEDAVRKMTSLPAQTFNLRNRGLLREGYAGDIVIFDDAKVGERATFASPHQYAAGINFVIVNGQTVLTGGEMTKARPGMALRGPGFVN